MSTSIQYGDILLRDCATRLFEQKTEFDSDGITAKFYTYRVSVVGYFVTNSQAGFEGPAIDTTGGTGPMPAGARYTTLREALTTPRLPFRMTTGTGTAQQTTILEALPAPENPGNYTPGQTLSENLDRNGGPKVVSLQIQDIYANKTFRVNVTFEISLRPLCGVSAGADVPQMAYGVISNRWSCSDNIDSNRFTTRTYNGELTLSSPTINPHEFRFLCLPPLAEGFRRADMEFVGQKDNLKLRYMIRDEQVTVSAPGFGNEFSDGTEIEVRQEDNVAQMATFVTTHLSVKLKGGPRAQRRTLVQIAAAYVDAKLQLHRQVRPLDEPRAPRNVFVESYVLQEEFGTSKTNQVGISIILKRTPDSEEYAQERLVKNVLKTFGNEVNGAALAGVTEDPVLTAFLVDYNHLQSYGNRTYPSGVLPNETPQPYGGTREPVRALPS